MRLHATSFPLSRGCVPVFPYWVIVIWDTTLIYWNPLFPPTLPSDIFTSHPIVTNDNYDRCGGKILHLLRLISHFPPLPQLRYVGEILRMRPRVD